MCGLLRRPGCPRSVGAVIAHGFEGRIPLVNAVEKGSMGGRNAKNGRPMSTLTQQHPLELLYAARDSLQAAVHAIQAQTSEQVSANLSSYGTVHTSIVYEFREILTALTENVDTNHPTFHVAYDELREIISRYDQLIADIQRHQPTIAELRHENVNAESG